MSIYFAYSAFITCFIPIKNRLKMIYSAVEKAYKNPCIEEDFEIVSSSVLKLMEKYLLIENYSNIQTEVSEHLAIVLLASYWIVRKWEYDSDIITATNMAFTHGGDKMYAKMLIDTEMDILLKLNFDIYSLMPNRE